jgi:uncharacterized protein (TIGR02611 family)
MTRPTRAHLVALLRVLWRSSRRGLVILGGFALLLGGIAMLVLPGPGLLVIIAGLALLAREFVWAERVLEQAKRRAANGAGAVKRVARRRNSSSADPAPLADDSGD